jgi:SAM-dependent methyltransferase
MTNEAHWNRVYETKAADRVSWYAPHLEQSLALIGQAALPKDAAIIDVGGGASTLPTDLLALGYTNVAVLDIAQAAIDKAKAQLGARSAEIRWLVGDVTTVPLAEGAYDLWHDRAVFHFLTDERDRAAYVRQVERALRPGGRVIVATFGPGGPDACSGLPVVRYDDPGLVAQFGGVFERLHCLEQTHTTPWGSTQSFVYCLCRRRE